MAISAAFAKGYFDIRARASDPWQKMDAMVLRGCEAMYRATGESDWRDGALAFLYACVSPEGDVARFPWKERNLAPLDCAPALLFAFDETGDARFRRAADALAEWLKAQPRCACGNYWARETAPDQVRLDALYFALPFQTAYDARFGDKRMAKDTALQLKNARKYLFDEEKRVYRPARDMKTDMLRPEPVGFSQRCAGLFLLGLAECAGAMDMQLYEHYRTAADLILEAVQGLLPDCRKHAPLLFDGDKMDEQPAAMVLAAVLKGVRLGLLDEEKYRPFALKAAEALLGAVHGDHSAYAYGLFTLLQAEMKEV